MNANVVQMKQILPFGYGCGNRGIQITKICKTYFRYCTEGLKMLILTMRNGVYCQN